MVRRDLSKGFLYVLMAILSFIIAAPLLWMILSAFKDRAELWVTPPTFWPHSPTLSGFKTVFQMMPFGRYFLNSSVVSVSTTLITLFTSALAGYVFAKLRFRGKNLLFILILASMMIPFQVTIVPNFMLIRWLGWYNTYAALIVPSGISVFGIFLMRQFMHSIPSDYLDAARVDGMGEFKLFYKIILPLSKPALSALAIFSFRGSWDSLIWPMIMTSTTEMKTLPMGIAGLATVHSPELQLLLPAATVTAVPMLIIFFIFQKQFIEGITMSGLKV